MSRIEIWKLFILVGVLILVSGCGGSTSSPTATVTPTAPAEPVYRDMTPIVSDFLAKLAPDRGLIASQDLAQKKTFIVDVRQPEEYSQGFIQGAANIPIRELVRNLQALPGMDQEIVVVCGSGHRSAIAMAALQMLGYKQVKSLTGGMATWQAAKLPVVTTPVPSRPSGAPPQVDAETRDALDHYLTSVLPDDWGLMTQTILAEDQKKISNLEFDKQPDHYEQGPSILVDVDEPDEFAKQTLPKSINIPLGGLVTNLDKIPADQITLYA